MHTPVLFLFRYLLVWLCGVVLLFSAIKSNFWVSKTEVHGSLVVSICIVCNYFSFSRIICALFDDILISAALMLFATEPITPISRTWSTVPRRQRSTVDRVGTVDHCENAVYSTYIVGAYVCGSGLLRFCSVVVLCRWLEIENEKQTELPFRKTA